MTPTAAALIRKIATNRLAELRIEQAELEQALRELDGPVGGGRNAGANSFPIPSPPPPAPSPSSERLDELRDLHGPVFRVIPKVPVEVGQKIKNADGTAIEMLELDNLGNERGEVAANAWFAKQVE